MNKKQQVTYHALIWNSGVCRLYEVLVVGRPVLHQDSLPKSKHVLCISTLFYVQ